MKTIKESILKSTDSGKKLLDQNNKKLWLDMKSKYSLEKTIFAMTNEEKNEYQRKMGYFPEDEIMERPGYYTNIGGKYQKLIYLVVFDSYEKNTNICGLRLVFNPVFLSFDKAKDEKKLKEIQELKYYKRMKKMLEELGWYEENEDSYSTGFICTFDRNKTNV